MHKIINEIKDIQVNDDDDRQQHTTNGVDPRDETIQKLIKENARSNI